MSARREVNLSLTCGETAPEATRLSGTSLSELTSSATSVRRLCQLDEDSPETHCAFCDRPWFLQYLGNDSGQSCALVSGGTAQAMRLRNQQPPSNKTRNHFGFSLTY